MINHPENNQTVGKTPLFDFLKKRNNVSAANNTRTSGKNRETEVKTSKKRKPKKKKEHKQIDGGVCKESNASNLTCACGQKIDFVHETRCEDCFAEDQIRFHGRDQKANILW